MQKVGQVSSLHKTARLNICSEWNILSFQILLYFNLSGPDSDLFTCSYVMVSPIDFNSEASILSWLPVEEYQVLSDLNKGIYIEPSWNLKEQGLFLLLYCFPKCVLICLIFLVEKRHCWKKKSLQQV